MLDESGKWHEIPKGLSSRRDWMEVVAGALLVGLVAWLMFGRAW